MTNLIFCFSQVSSDMTAGRVCAEIVSQMQLPSETDWALFEVIDNGTMGKCYCSGYVFHCHE